VPVGVTGRHVARALGLLVVLPALGGGLFALGLVAIGADGPSTGATTTRSGAIGRSRPRPIPIPARSCPFLKAVQEASVPVGTASWHLLVGGPNDRVTGGDDLAAKLSAFDLSLRVAATQTPGPVRSDLTSVALDVERGQALLRSAPNSQTFVDRALTPLADGVIAFQDASDLIGGACGTRLSPDFLP
jgi:hypothetical protein